MSLFKQVIFLLSFGYLTQAIYPNCELPQYNIKLNNGQHLKATKPHCLECDCNYGHIQCQSPNCSIPQCARGSRIDKDPNKCCGYKCVARPKLNCVLPQYNIRLNHGQHLKATKPHCLECDCNDGHIQCKSPNCLIPKCARGYRIDKDPNQCCGYKCVARQKLNCELRQYNIKLNHGQHLKASKPYCLECDCNDGHIQCKSPRCRLPQCAAGSRIIIDPNLCCPYKCGGLPKSETHQDSQTMGTELGTDEEFQETFGFEEMNDNFHTMGAELDKPRQHCTNVCMGRGKNRRCQKKCLTLQCLKKKRKCNKYGCYTECLKYGPKTTIEEINSESTQNMKYYTIAAGFFGLGLMGFTIMQIRRKKTESNYELL